MKNRFVPHLAWLAVIGFCLAGCHSDPDKLDRPENPFKSSESGPGKTPLSDRELRAKADQLYRRAHDSLESSDYSTAITRYDELIARYPFSDYSTQAELEKIYAQYKSFQSDDAVIAADRFLRAHPRHPHADYVLYLKGLTDFARDTGVFTYLSDEVESSKRDVGNQFRAFEDFSLLLQKYPKSVYAGDARRRMLYARNRIADHELSVAQFYVSRGAYVAAAKRASDIIMQYPSAPATVEALKILQESDAKLGLSQQAKDADALIATNTGKVEFTDPPPPRTTVMPRDPESPRGARGHAKQAATPAATAPPAAPAAAAPAAPPATAQPPTAPTAAPGQTSLAPPPQPAAQPILLAESDQAGQQSEQPAAHPGIFTKFANLFSPLDTSRPENQHVYVIGGSSGKAPTDAAPAASTAAAPANENADVPASAPSAPASGGLKFHLRAHMPGDDDDTAPATAQPAPTQS